MKDPRKILIAFNFWDGDRKRMMEVAKFLASIEGGVSKFADVLFMARFDCPQDRKAIEEVSAKFHTLTATSRRRERGWPTGCNGLFFGTVDWLYEQKVARKLPHDYKAFLLHESDAAPLTRGWIESLSKAWDDAQVRVLGAYQESPGPHINGNALYSMETDFLHRISREIAGCAPKLAYDMVLYKEFEKWGVADTPLIRSVWRTPTITAAELAQLKKEGVVFLHGVKDSSATAQFSD